MSLKVEIVFLILVVKTILKKPTLTSMTVLVLKSIRLQIVTLLFVIGNVGQSESLSIILLMMKMV